MENLFKGPTGLAEMRELTTRAEKLADDMPADVAYVMILISPDGTAYGHTNVLEPRMLSEMFEGLCKQLDQKAEQAS